jgi:hypothetical protein
VDGLVSSEDIALVAVFQAENEVLLELVSAVNQLKDFLVALHPEGLEEHEHGD